MIDFTEADLRKFSPKMADAYRQKLLSGKAYLATAGILANGQRFSHFMGQVGAETGGGTILRESLTYTSVNRIKAVWPARSAKTSDADLQKLVRNPVALGDWAYGGRMGNRKGTSDGYDYRGGGFIQTTGRAAVQKYCDLCRIEIRPDILDDLDATLQFACAEWKESGCNELADANDLIGISKAINTGSATSGVIPNGMTDREAWFKKARAIWWDAEPAAAPADAPAPTIATAAAPPSTAAVLGQTMRSSRTIFGILLTFGASLVSWFQEAIAQIQLLEPVKQIGSGLGLNLTTIIFAITVAGLALALFARLDDAHKGKVLK